MGGHGKLSSLPHHRRGYASELIEIMWEQVTAVWWRMTAYSWVSYKLETASHGIGIPFAPLSPLKLPVDVPRDEKLGSLRPHPDLQIRGENMDRTFL
jgi:hypothetical protein